MVIEFKEKQIVKREERRREPYIGYFSPNGKLIDYNVLLGGNYHDAWHNPVSWAFLTWVSYIIKETSIEKLKEWAFDKKMVDDNKYPGLDEYVKRGYESTYEFNYQSFDEFLNLLYDRISHIEDDWHRFKEIDDYTAFEYQLLLFFKNAYKEKTFFDTIQRKISIDNPDTVKKRLKCKYGEREFDSCGFINRVDSDYTEYLKRELLSYFKDICVQYLGYDSLERFKTNITKIDIPYWYEEYDFDFVDNPRIITSSYPNVNERYFNYLIMDWTVQRLPRYYYNSQTGLYEKSNLNMFYQSDKEQILEQEINSIKKLVPISERKKYFR